MARITNSKKDVKVVKIGLCNWEANVDYPSDQRITKWMNESTMGDYLLNNDFCKKNKICVYTVSDGEYNGTQFLITAPMTWIMENEYECLLDYADNNMSDVFETADEYDKFPEYTEDNFGTYKMPSDYLSNDSTDGYSDDGIEDDIDDYDGYGEDDDDYRPSGNKKKKYSEDEYEESPYENSDIFDD